MNQFGINQFGGQSLADRVNAARYALTGQGLARTVCKATTEELLPPKKKHLDYLLQCTHESNVSMPQLGSLLMERALDPASSWVVVFKTLNTMHHLMCFGHERFSQFLASAPDVGLEQISRSFIDRTNTVGGTEMAPFVRRYSGYMLARVSSFRSQGFDFAKVKRVSDGKGVCFFDFSLDKVLKTLPVLLVQVDSLLEFNAKQEQLANPVVKGVFILLFRDFVRLFASLNDCIIIVLEKFFSLQDTVLARNCLQVYQDFSFRLDRINAFLKLAQSVGQDIPELARAPFSLLNSMEAHCLVLEGKDPTEVLNRKEPVKEEVPPPPSSSNPFMEQQQQQQQDLNPFKETNQTQAFNPFL